MHTHVWPLEIALAARAEVRSRAGASCLLLMDLRGRGGPRKGCGGGP